MTLPAASEPAQEPEIPEESRHYTSSLSFGFDPYQHFGWSIEPQTRVVKEKESDHRVLYNGNQDLWSRWHQITTTLDPDTPHEVNGTHRDLMDLCDYYDMRKVSPIVASFGYRNAVSMNFYYPYERLGPDTCIARQSGFLMEGKAGKFVITCTHFYLKDNFNNRERADLFKLLANPKGTAICYANTGPIANDDDIETSSKSKYCVALWNIDADADIAIFRVIDGPKDQLTNLPTIEDLYALPSDYSEGVFGVAYASQNFLMKNNQATVYDFVRDDYLDNTLTEKNTRKLPKLRRKRPPFANIFKADYKALNAGRVRNNFPVEGNTKNTLLAHRRHTMSSWHGCSGGMVGIPSKISEEVQLRIVGMLTSGNSLHDETNAFLAFTELSIAWISKVINSPAVDPGEFGAGKFMEEYGSR